MSWRCSNADESSYTTKVFLRLSGKKCNESCNSMIDARAGSMESFGLCGRAARGFLSSGKCQGCKFVIPAKTCRSLVVGGNKGTKKGHQGDNHHCTTIPLLLSNPQAETASAGLLVTAGVSGIGTGPPGESSRRAVKTSTPSSVTNIVCSEGLSVKCS